MPLPDSPFLVEPGTRAVLDDFDPRGKYGMEKKSAKKELKELSEQLNDLQEQLYATKQHGLLVLLQGMDTSGKDGVIKRVLEAFNPQGVCVTGFKVPTQEEFDHDFLWRIHKAAPRKGMVGVFNRSQYEDVLVQRVESFVSEPVWRQRYEDINAFEKLLASNGTVICKFYLHISNERQQERLQDRLLDPTSHWKFSVGDLKARAKWDEYREAYEDALSYCSTPYAPWYIIPADRKWVRDIVIARILLETLGNLRMEWPPLEKEARHLTTIV
ncbi:MAG: PPK2 family polyphosphate kinase [Anaerolineae bacterium]|jgi:PPK2 family polyphosphate:nucleotide phosphotransferase